MKTYYLPLAGLLALPLQPLARPIEFAGRDVPVVVADDSVVSGTSARGWAPAAVDPLQVAFTLTAGQVGRPYGLLVPYGAATARVAEKTLDCDAPAVSFNGRKLDIDPLFRKDGTLYYVPSGYLREGGNTLAVSRPAADAGSAWTGTALFTLDGSTEEVHFGAMFTDAPNAVRSLPAPDPLQAKYDIRWYDCSWQPSLTNSTLTSATVWIGATSLDSTLATAVFDYDSNTNALAVASVDGGPGTPALAYTVDNTNKRLRVTLPAAVASGAEFRVRVAYSGTPRPSGTFGAPYVRSTHGSPSKAVVYTFSEPYGARQWWPCKDQPEDKATTTIQRITVPSGAGWQVVSNGKLASVTPSGGNEVWTWVNSHPISTYLLSVCVTNYAYSSATYTALDAVTTMPIRHAIYPENAATEGSAAAGTLQVMNFFAQTFGEYPFLDEKYYTASHNSGSGMEHQTCTSMPGNNIDGVGVDDGRQRRNVHELSHHWFGDLVTCRNFDHLWLNEGFATYSEAMWDEYYFGNAAFLARVTGWTVSTTQPTVGPSSDNFSGAAVYRKGGWTLHMLRHVVGDATFFQILRNWVADPARRYSTAVTQDFENLCEATSGKDLTVFFSQWLLRPTFSGEPVMPLYRYSGSVAKAGTSHTLNLVINQTQSGTPFQMPLDVRVKNAAGATQTLVVGNTAASQNYALDLGAFAAVEADLDPDSWVLRGTGTTQNLMGISLNTVGLPPGQAGVVYSRTLRASGGTSPYTFTATAGTLPPGMTLSTGGVLGGTPTAAGTYNIPFTVTDNAAATRSATLTLEITNSSTVGEWSDYR